MNIDEMKDRIARAEEIQRYTENRCEVLEKENAELKSENQKWKDEWQEQVQKAIDEGHARTLQTIQLSKAKEIIKKLCIRQDDYCIDCTCYKFLENMRAEAEQFLSEVGK